MARGNRAIVMIQVMIITCALILLAVPIYSADFSDLPRTHWAAGSVYPLVKEGLVSGYPDGTFRGKKLIDRYGMASFAAKLLGYSDAKLRDSEIKQIRVIRELWTDAEGRYAELTDGYFIQVHGSYEQRFRYGNALVDGTYRGALQTDGRLKLTLAKKLSKEVSLVVRLDTMDSLFNTTADRDRTALLWEAEAVGAFNWGLPKPLEVKFLMGPGSVTHTYGTAGFFFPSDYKIKYDKVRPSIYLSTDISSARVTAAYIARGLVTLGNGSGEIKVDQLRAKVQLGKIPLPWLGILEVQGRVDQFLGNAIDYNSITARMVALGLALKPNPAIEFSLETGCGSRNSEGWAFDARVNYKDAMSTGTEMYFRSQKVGSLYRNPVLASELGSIVPYDIYEREIVNGTTDMSLVFRQALWVPLKFYAQMDKVYQGNMNYGSAFTDTNQTIESGLNIALPHDLGLDLFYSNYQRPALAERTFHLAGMRWRCEF